MYYKVVIDETAQGKEENDEGEVFFKSNLFNQICENFKNIKGVIEYLKDRYFNFKFSNLNKVKNKIFIDDKKGDSSEIGFICNYWNKDVSYNSKAWRQQDWVIIKEVKENYLTEKTLKGLIKKLKN